MQYRSYRTTYKYYQILTASITKIWIVGKRDKTTIEVRDNKLRSKKLCDGAERYKI